MPLPMEVWRQVALHMSTRDLAKGLAQVGKAFRHLGASAICLSSSKGKDIQCAGAFSIVSGCSHAIIACCTPCPPVTRRDRFRLDTEALVRRNQAAPQAQE